MIKRIMMVLAGAFFTTTTFAAGLAGDWQGELQVQPGVSLPLVLHLTEGDTVWKVSIDSPAQQAYGIPGTVQSVTDESVNLKFDAIGAQLEATLVGEKLKGTFSQAGATFDLTLTPQSREDKSAATAPPERPQNPQPPYPYQVEEVTYPHNSEDFSFAATLTLPTGQGPFPAAILASGSGPQDRDETLMGHKPFWVLADHLTRAGIAVLRFDDRGTAQSGGTFAGTTLEGFSTDVGSAYSYLASRNDIAPDKIGLIGHSEGGMTAPLFASKKPDVAFMVLLAAIGVDGKTLWAEQQRDIAGAYGNTQADAIYDVMKNFAQQIVNGADPQELKQDLLEAGYDDATATRYVTLLASAWGKSFLSYQPTSVLSQLRMPVLAINGDKDLQVAADSNLSGIRAIFAESGNPDVTVKVMQGQNHLFQEAGSGLPDEYARISQTIAPQTLNLISNWIIKRMTE